MLRGRARINAVVDTSDVDNVDNLNTLQYNKENLSNFTEWLAASAAHDAYYMPHPQGGLYKRDMNAIQFLYIISGSDRDFIHGIMEGLRNAPVGLNVGDGVMRTFLFVVDFSDGENDDFGLFLKSEIEANFRARLLTEFIIVDFNRSVYFKVLGGKVQDKDLKKILDNIGAATGMTAEKRSVWTEFKKASIKRTLNDIRPMKKGDSVLVPVVLIVFLNVLIYVIDVIFSLKTGNKPLETFGIQDNKLVWEGEWWRLITANFLHADIAHIAGNMVMLVLISRILRNFYSNLQYIVIYMVTALVGSLCTLFFMAPDILSLGASGAVMGIGGVLCFRMFFGSNAKYFRRTANCITIIAIVGYNLIVGLSDSGINNWAHFAGFITGFLMAWVIHLFQKLKQKNKSRTSA